MIALRQCNICGLKAECIEDLKFFTKNKKYKFGRQNFCKACDNSRAKKLQASKENYHKESYVKRKYNITLDEYNKCMNTSIVCEICGSTHRLVYDHNHNTGEFRGVLCDACNTSLGKFKDNPIILFRAYKYLLSRGNYSN